MTDQVTAFLQSAGLPVTRQTYIEVNWWGAIPDPWTPEDEAELPEELQDWDLFQEADGGASVVAKPGAAGLAQDAWEESEHPRGEAGKFAREASKESPPNAGEPFLVYRAGTGAHGDDLHGNAGNADAVAYHLARSEDPDQPAFGDAPDTIRAWRVTANKFGPYATVVGGRGGGDPDAVGVGGNFGPHGLAFSFPDSGYQAELVGKAPISAVRQRLEQANGEQYGRPSDGAHFDFYGSNLGAEAIRAALKGHAQDEWDESKHPRGQPENAGEFGPGGGGGAKPKEGAPKPEGAAPAASAPPGGHEAPRAARAPAGPSSAPSGGGAAVVEHLFKPAAIQHLPRAATQPFKSWEEASALAPAARDELDTILKRVAKTLGARTDLINPKELKKPEDLSGSDNFVFGADIKREARSREKVGEGPSAEHPEGVGDYRGDWNQLRDMVRGTITVGSFNDLGHAVQALEDEGLTLSQLPKNRFANNPTPEGYRDLNLVLKLPNSPLHVEVQLNLKKMVAAKEKGHKFYEVQRTLQGPKGYSEQEPTERWNS